MLVISQNGNRRFTTTSTKFIVWISTIVAINENDENYRIVGKFKTIRRANEILSEIEKKHKTGTPMYHIPRE